MSQVEQIQAALLRDHNLRVSEAVAEYVLAHLNGTGELAVIGGDAMTGIARRMFIPVNELATDLRLEVRG